MYPVPVGAEPGTGFWLHDSLTRSGRSGGLEASCPSRPSWHVYVRTLAPIRGPRAVIPGAVADSLALREAVGRERLFGVPGTLSGHAHDGATESVMRGHCDTA